MIAPSAYSPRRARTASAADDGLVARVLGRRPLPAVWEEMKRFTAGRGPETRDEVWFVEHPPIFTLGLNGNAAHVLNAGDIPVLKIDRGGQVTYHGPGQLVAYTLLDLGRLKLGIRGLVEALERAVVDTAAGYGIEARGAARCAGGLRGKMQAGCVGAEDQPAVFVPRNRAERGHGPRAVFADQSLRVRGVAGDGSAITVRR